MIHDHQTAPTQFVEAKARKDCLGRSSTGRLSQSLGQVRHGPRLVTVERLAEQLLLVSEGGVYPSGFKISGL
jgi:hypothetical protein